VRIKTTCLRPLAAASCFVFLVGSSRADADDIQDKMCVLNAAPQLPVISGLRIIASRVTPLPRPKARKVEIDISAAGIEATVSFDCEFDGVPPATKVLPRGLTK
jgi:hypothetical protein